MHSKCVFSIRVESRFSALQMCSFNHHFIRAKLEGRRVCRSQNIEGGFSEAQNEGAKYPLFFSQCSEALTFICITELSHTVGVMSFPADAISCHLFEVS